MYRDYTGICGVKGHKGMNMSSKMESQIDKRSKDEMHTGFIQGLGGCL